METEELENDGQLNGAAALKIIAIFHCGHLWDSDQVSDFEHMN